MEPHLYSPNNALQHCTDFLDSADLRLQAEELLCPDYIDDPRLAGCMCALEVHFLDSERSRRPR